MAACPNRRSARRPFSAGRLSCGGGDKSLLRQDTHPNPVCGVGVNIQMALRDCCDLQAIIAVGFKVNSDRAVPFRKWANAIVKYDTIQGWAMDSGRLKNGGSVLTKEYFDRLREQIREIRMSEHRFYQKITDTYAAVLNFDKSAKTPRLFFAEVQNKLHWAIHRYTAAELIIERADAPHMGLTSWEQYPDGENQKYDVSPSPRMIPPKRSCALEEKMEKHKEST